ncbi:MAG: hypothetical protein MUF43_10485 [Flavobacterium sp.]|jgi:hypothetical protein|nr:hypothetical protein [Flavobacterium sp.]MCU0393572.1 hypothetical protein [Thermoflexibacter sp.]
MIFKNLFCRKQGGKKSTPKSTEEKIKVYATKQGALYIKVEELFAQKKVQDVIAKSLKIKVVGSKEGTKKLD